MKKESRASKIASGFSENMDIDALAALANQIAAPSMPSAVIAPPVVAPVTAPVEIVLEETETVAETPKKDRRFTIILPHDLYMKMVLKTKSEGISFTKYIHKLMEKDLEV